MGLSCASPFVDWGSDLGDAAKPATPPAVLCRHAWHDPSEKWGMFWRIYHLNPDTYSAGGRPVTTFLIRTIVALFSALPEPHSYC